MVNDTPAHYASIVTNPQMKWKYFERQWKDAHLWKYATDPESWLPGGKRALNSLWEEYKNLPTAGPSAGSKRARTPDGFEFETDMTQVPQVYSNVDRDQSSVTIVKKLGIRLSGAKTSKGVRDAPRKDIDTRTVMRRL